jgi:alkanesulfonate monooxygenase SsuD/methylene tetrahydromethanopterin reductase-like flavin-dependent oxidoreductase (luciferase family)
MGYMKFGFVLPKGDARTAAELAKSAETAGWDGFFMWDPVWGIDPMVGLAAAAMVTERIRLGTMVTPVSRHRPWKLAGELATLDNLSNGRAILSAGLGALDTGFEEFGEETDRKKRAELLDEGLEIMEGLWRGQPFSFSGKHYQIRPTKFYQPPPPVQQPRIPIWVVGAWPRPKSMQRVLHWDGLLPAKMSPDGKFAELTAEDVREMKAWIDARRTQTTPFEIVVEGKTPGDDRVMALEKVHPWIEAGATWWIEAMWDDNDLDHVRKRIEQGAPGKG